MNFDSHERELLGKLADVLIPVGNDRLSASQAKVAQEGLDLVLAARPDLAAGLKTLLLKAASRDPAAAVADLQASDPAAFGVLTEVAAGAYFMHPAVRAAIGYAGQTPQAIDPRPDYMEDGLLESVLRRGPIYRPTP